MYNNNNDDRKKEIIPDWDNREYNIKPEDSANMESEEQDTSNNPVEESTYHYSKNADNLPIGSYAEEIEEDKSSNNYSVDSYHTENNRTVNNDTEPKAYEVEKPKPNYQYTANASGGKKKKAGQGTMVKTAAIAIVCSLVFGTAGGYLGSSLNSSNNEAAQAASTLTPSNTDSSAEPSSSSNTVTNTSAVTGDTLSASEIYELASQQVVSINIEYTTSYYGQAVTGAAAGTGFVISEDGYIVTNYHVVSYATSGGNINVTFKNGETYAAQYIGGYEAGDVALLKIEATGLSAATLGDSNNITVGENIYVVGNALGEYDYTLTGGLVSGLDRVMDFTNEDGTAESINMFQIDAAVNSGNSGGPVYNSKGEVIGIVTSKISSSTSSSAATVEGLGFAIPINDASSIVNDILTKGYVEGSVLLNLSVKTVASTAVEYGVPSGAYVMEINSGGAAEAAGVQVQDIITKIDDKEITSVSDLKLALKSYSVGDSASLTVYRTSTGETLELTVTFTQTENTSATTETQDNSSGSDAYGYGDDNYGYGDNYGGSGNSGGFGGIFG